MKLRFVLLLSLGLAALCAGCRFGETQPTMAVISTRDVITKCDAGLKAAEEVRGKFASRQEALKKQEEALAKLKADPAASDPKSGKRAELEALARQFIADSQALRKDIGEEEAIRFRPIVERINKVLADYAAEHNLTSVQDKNGFAFIHPSIDITEAIIKKMDDAK